MTSVYETTLNFFYSFIKDHGNNSITSQVALQLLNFGEDIPLSIKTSESPNHVTFLLRQRKDFWLLISPWELLQLYFAIKFCFFFSFLRFSSSLNASTSPIAALHFFLHRGSNLRFENRFNCKSERGEADIRAASSLNFDSVGVCLPWHSFGGKWSILWLRSAIAKFQLWFS